MKSFFQKFKEFAMRGNVVDMAIGVVIGSAFSKIVSSLVEDLIMPLLSAITGRVNLSELSCSIPAYAGGDPIVVPYGNFLQALLDFLLIALSIFIAIQVINRIHKKLAQEKAPEETTSPASEPTKEEALLTEIRDLLKNPYGGLKAEKAADEE